MPALLAQAPELVCEGVGRWSRRQPAVNDLQQDHRFPVEPVVWAFPSQNFLQVSFGGKGSVPPGGRHNGFTRTVIP